MEERELELCKEWVRMKKVRIYKRRKEEKMKVKEPNMVNEK